MKSFLEKSSLFEIFQLSTVISNELENHNRIAAVRKTFQEGDIIDYFDESTRTIISALVLAKKNKYVSVQNCADQQRWKIPYYVIKTDDREFDFSQSGKGLTKNTLKVGDWVGFNHDGKEIIGCIQRLNQKTVSLMTKNNHGWRVAYSWLYSVIDGDCHQANIIEHVS